MKHFKKILRLLGFTMIILLASIGLALNVAVLPTVFNRDETSKPKIEIVESREEEEDDIDEQK